MVQLLSLSLNGRRFAEVPFLQWFPQLPFPINIAVICYSAARTDATWCEWQTFWVKYGSFVKADVLLLGVFSFRDFILCNFKAWGNAPSVLGIKQFLLAWMRDMASYKVWPGPVHTAGKSISMTQNHTRAETRGEEGFKFVAERDKQIKFQSMQSTRLWEYRRSTKSNIIIPVTWVTCWSHS